VGPRIHARSNTDGGYDQLSLKWLWTVEVAVSNVDLLPNSIDSVVIRDRLYTLPIEVEGLETRAEQDTQMDVDNGHSVASGSGEKKGGTDGENKYENKKRRRITKDQTSQTICLTELNKLIAYKKYNLWMAKFHKS
jgi:hypothetical protein